MLSKGGVHINDGKVKHRGTSNTQIKSSCIGATIIKQIIRQKRKKMLFNFKNIYIAAVLTAKVKLLFLNFIKTKVKYFEMVRKGCN